MEILLLLLFVLFVLLGAVLPGVFFAALVFRKDGRDPGPEALAALALLSGFIFQISLWALLRLAGLNYPLVCAVHLTVVSVLGFFTLRDKEARRGCAAMFRSIFSAETGVFLSVAVILAAWLTYDTVQLYYNDELFRMSLAEAVRRTVPAQNMLLWTGALKYYYAMEFFAGSASAVAGIPLETVYFRYMLPLNWLLLFFGMRGILAQSEPGFKRYLPHAAFLLFFLAHTKMLAHFTFRQNTFALGLSVLAMSALWTSVRTKSVFFVLVCAVAAGFITLVKAPCGALYLVLFCVFMALSAREGTVGVKRSAAFILLAMLAWFSAYRSLAGTGFDGAAALFEISSRPGWLKEFLPRYILDPELLSSLRAAGFAGGFLAAGLKTLENSLTFLVSGLLACLAGLFCLRRGRYGAAVAGPGRALLLSAFAVFITGAFLFCFVHYRISNGSDSYWLFFSVWFLAAAAFPLFLSSISERLSTRVLSALTLIPAVTLFQGAVWRQDMKFLLFAGAVSVAGLILYVSGRGDAGPASEGKSRFPKWLFLAAGAALFFLSRFILGPAHYAAWWFLPSWIFGAAAAPFFISEMNIPAGRRILAMCILVPFLSALSCAPRYLYWASAWKTWSREVWSDENQQACAAMNAAAERDGLYIHNLLNRPGATLAAMCKRRMYVSYTEYDAVWEDKRLYSEALNLAADFFNWKMEKPCAWLKARGINYIYWDSAGSAYGFQRRAAGVPWLSKIYEGKEVSLYAIGQCDGETARKGKMK